MTLTAPIPIQQPAPHPDITVTARLPLTPGTDARDMLNRWRALLELVILRQLLHTPWSILDGDVDWRLIPEVGKQSVLLRGVWTQR